MKHAKFVSFTECGAQTAQRAAALLPEYRCELYARTVDMSLNGTALTRFAQQAMMDCNLMVFVGAAGIAVRAVAPYLMGKAYDPAVIVIDEQGRFVIPLLSGHLGGANILTEQLAKGLGAVPVITTATDGRQVFAVDSWAKAHGCTVYDPEQIRYVSGALLRGETIGLHSAFPVDGILPPQIGFGAAQSGFMIGFDTTAQPFSHTLHLVPRIAVLGLGCRKGTSERMIADAVHTALQTVGVPMCAVSGAASIDLKCREAGLLLFCETHRLPFTTYSAKQLMQLTGDFTPSDFVAQTVGVDNVCERAAVMLAGNGRLLLRKFAQNGVTVALAAPEWHVRMEEERTENGG